MVKLRHYFIVIAIALVFFILGNCFDFNVSSVLFNDNEHYAAAIIASNYLIYPFFFVFYLAVFMLFMSPAKGRGRRTWLPKVIAVLGFLATTYFYFTELREFSGSAFFGDTIDMKLYGEAGMWVQNAVLFVAILVGVVLVYFKFIAHCDNTKAMKVAMLIICVFLADLAISTLIKFIWSRPRPWYVFAADPKTIFKNLWQPNPFGALNHDPNIKSMYLKSFPSGHSERCVLLVGGLISLSSLLPKFNNERSRTIFLYLALLLGFFNGFLRLLGGAHFLSDISFGVILSLTIVYFGNWIANKYHLVEFGEVAPIVE